MGEEAPEPERGMRADGQGTGSGPAKGTILQAAQGTVAQAEQGTILQSDPAVGGTDTRHPTNAIDETVHQRHRLGILTITAEAQRAEFGYLREALGMTAGNLSRHLTVLEDAGLIQVEKGYQGRRPRTWVQITRTGRTALAAELAALTELVRQLNATVGRD
jgi:DNA-binding MarR family transcriptional regulator